MPRPARLGDNKREMDITWNFVRSGALTVVPIADADLPALEALMRKYHDRPMDYADATLVHLAHRESISTVFTIAVQMTIGLTTA